MQSTVHRYLTNTTKESRRTTLQPVADYFGVDVGAFFDEDKARAELARLKIATIQGENSDNTQSGNVIQNVTAGPDPRGPYPLISEVQAGMWTELCDNFQPGDADERYTSAKNLGKCGYLLRVKGRSMYAPGERHSFPEGMILHVNPDLEPSPGQFVIVRREYSKEATFKRYVLIDGTPYLEAINPDWPKDEKYLKLQKGDAWCGVVVDASIGGLP